MTINTEVLPVRAVRWVVPAIPVFMVYSEKLPILEIKLSPAFGANKAVDFQGLLSVIGVSSSTLFQFPDNISNAFVSCRLFWLRFFDSSLSDSQKITSYVPILYCHGYSFSKSLGFIIVDFCGDMCHHKHEVSEFLYSKWPQRLLALWPFLL
jgi:hypothetical protein